jgi:hypothetical protein
MLKLLNWQNRRVLRAAGLEWNARHLAGHLFF